MRLVLPLALAACAVAAPPPQPAAARRGVDVLDYSILIDLPDSGNVIRGDATLTVRRTAPVDVLTLDLRSLTVVRVTVDRQPVRYSRTDSTLGIPLPHAHTYSTTNEVEVAYAGAVTTGSSPDATAQDAGRTSATTGQTAPATGSQASIIPATRPRSAGRSVRRARKR